MINFIIIKVVELFRKYKGRFDGNTTRWVFDKELLIPLTEELKNQGFKVEEDEFPAVKKRKIKVFFKLINK